MGVTLADWPVWFELKTKPNQAGLNEDHKGLNFGNLTGFRPEKNFTGGCANRNPNLKTRSLRRGQTSLAEGKSRSFWKEPKGEPPGSCCEIFSKRKWDIKPRAKMKREMHRERIGGAKRKMVIVVSSEGQFHLWYPHQRGAWPPAEISQRHLGCDYADDNLEKRLLVEDEASTSWFWMSLKEILRKDLNHLKKLQSGGANPKFPMTSYGFWKEMSGGTKTELNSIKKTCPIMDSGGLKSSGVNDGAITTSKCGGKVESGFRSVFRKYLLHDGYGECYPSKGYSFLRAGVKTRVAIVSLGGKILYNPDSLLISSVLSFPPHKTVDFGYDGTSRCNLFGIFSSNYNGISQGGYGTSNIDDIVEGCEIYQAYIIVGGRAQEGDVVICGRIKRHGLRVVVAGIREIIDSDIPIMHTSSGFVTTIAEASNASNIVGGWETRVEKGIGCVKLIERYSGFRVRYATLARCDVNYCFISESILSPQEKCGPYEVIGKRRKEYGHRDIIIIAERAGKDLVAESWELQEVSRDIVLKEIELWIGQKAKRHFPSRNLIVFILGAKHHNHILLLRKSKNFGNYGASVYGSCDSYKRIKVQDVGTTGCMFDVWRQKSLWFFVEGFVQTILDRDPMLVSFCTGEFHLLVNEVVKLILLDFGQHESVKADVREQEVLESHEILILRGRFTRTNSIHVEEHITWPSSRDGKLNVSASRKNCSDKWTFSKSEIPPSVVPPFGFGESIDQQRPHSHLQLPNSPNGLTRSCTQFGGELMANSVWMVVHTNDKAIVIPDGEDPWLEFCIYLYVCCYVYKYIHTSWEILIEESESGGLLREEVVASCGFWVFSPRNFNLKKRLSINCSLSLLDSLRYKHKCYLNTTSGTTSFTRACLRVKSISGRFLVHFASRFQFLLNLVDKVLIRAE